MSKGLIGEEIPRWIIVLLLLVILLIAIGVFSEFFFEKIKEIIGVF